jgi:hypothetical protein
MSQETLERAMMERLLAGDHPALETLRSQYAAAEVADRELTGVGCFVYWRVPSDAPRAAVGKSVVIDDVAFTFHGSEHGGCALLFVSEGSLDLLEMVMWAESWPGEPRLADVHYLTHVPTGDGEGSWLEQARERDWSHLARVLAPRSTPEDA